MLCLINIYHVEELGSGTGSVLKEILQKVFFATVLWEAFSEVPRPDQVLDMFLILIYYGFITTHHL